MAQGWQDEPRAIRVRITSRSSWKVWVWHDHLTTKPGNCRALGRRARGTAKDFFKDNIMVRPESLAPQNFLRIQTRMHNTRTNWM